MSDQLSLTFQEPLDFLSPLLLRTPTEESAQRSLLSALKSYKSKLDSTQNERYLVSNALQPLFEALGYRAQSERSLSNQKGNSGIDLLLKDSENNIRVLIEAKKEDSPEMMSETSYNVKALHEAILYYFQLRDSAKNTESYHINHIIITDFKSFYIFEARDFEKHLYAHKSLKEAYKKFKKNNEKTQDFYNEAKNILHKNAQSGIAKDHLFDNLRCCKVSLDDVLEAFSLTHVQHSAQANAFIKLFSKDCLFNEFNPNDANVLNERFYNELLYILGLYEDKSKASKIMRPSHESQAHQGTLYYNILSHLGESNPKEREIKQAATAALAKGELDEHILQILILWINRILFLKLLESSLISFNATPSDNAKALAFLHIDKISDYTTLNNLFFEVLAKPQDERANAPWNLRHLPYLNSSLFMRDESELITINALGDLKLEIYPHTQIKDKDAKPLRGEMPWLEYLFSFLDAFDFGLSSQESLELSSQRKDLINSAVLGLVFEQLNGYKDGSFYTPSFITSYMCKEALEKIVVEKFQASNPTWQIQNLRDIRHEIREELHKARNDQAQEAAIKHNHIALLDSIKICDPSVGSAHFLVSALNEMISIHFELGLFEMECRDLRLEHDEIDIIVGTSSSPRRFAYKAPHIDETSYSQDIQKALFGLKKRIIENNLFGVDINPNSVNIARLRLWIELLKSTYYKSLESSTYHDLETLPNIDINIKCGNSLVSRFELHDTLKQIPNINRQIETYKALVFEYKNADQSHIKNSKHNIEAKIKDLQRSFTLTLKDPKTKKALEKAIKDHIALYGSFALDDQSLLDGLSLGHKNLFGDTQELSAQEEEQAYASYGRIRALRKKLDSVTDGERYRNAFEWRFAFPEVLDSNGDFLGFDLVIGNPPYIDYREIPKTTLDNTKHYLINAESKRPNIYCFFVEKAISIGNAKALISFINPIAMLQADFAYGTRKLLIDKGCIDYIADCSHIKVFDSATTYPMVWGFIKNAQQSDIKISIWQNDAFVYSHNIESYESSSRLSINISQNRIDFTRIEHDMLSDLSTLKWGTSQSGYGKKKIKIDEFEKLSKTQRVQYRPIIQTADIKRYEIDWHKEYIPIEIYSDLIKEDFEKDKIVIARMTKKLQATLDTSKFYMGKSTLLIDFKVNPKYLLGLLNSKLVDFWYKYHFGSTHLGGGYIRYDVSYLKQLPIPKIDFQNKSLADEIIRLVEQILEIKARDSDLLLRASDTNTKELESQIDKLVYQLYDLSDSEIKTIQGE